MIEARDFIEAARERSFGWYAGVPCSYLTPFINYVVQDPSLRYFSMANEGDAVALIAGATLGNGGAPCGVTMMQNSGLGNAVSPLTSLTWTFRLPQLLIVTWRGQPGVADEPQHALMGPITPAMLTTMEIPWELFPAERPALGVALDRARAHLSESGRPYALVMPKGCVAPYALEAEARPVRLAAPARAVLEPHRHAPDRRPSRRAALEAVVAHTPVASTVVIAGTGFCGRELYALADRPNHLYMVGSMGCVSPLALGLSLARPDLTVVAIDGDGGALMRLGVLATIGAYGPPNLRHLLLDNGVHDSTGGQATVSPSVSFAEIAGACGYATTLETDEAARIGDWLQGPPAAGPSFARLLIRAGTSHALPRPSMSPVEVKQRLLQHCGAR